MTSLLYDKLLSDRSSSKLDWSIIDSTLKRSKIPLHQRQTIYMLILEHYFRAGTSMGHTSEKIKEELKELTQYKRGQKSNIVYSGTYIDAKEKKGCRIPIDKLPPILRDVINRYLSLCLEL